MRVRRLRERERLADVQLELALAHEREAPLGALARLLREVARDRRHHEAAHLLRLRRERRDVERIGRPAGAAVQDEMAERAETAQPFLERRLADRVEDEIDA